MVNFCIPLLGVALYGESLNYMVTFCAVSDLIEFLKHSVQEYMHG